MELPRGWLFRKKPRCTLFVQADGSGKRVLFEPFGTEYVLQGDEDVVRVELFDDSSWRARDELEIHHSAEGILLWLPTMNYRARNSEGKSLDV